MPKVKVTVTLTMPDGQTISASDIDVSLSDDPIIISAGNLGYSMIEEAWGMVPDE